jgi:hypothetical protein
MSLYYMLTTVQLNFLFTMFVRLVRNIFCKDSVQNKYFSITVSRYESLVAKA